MMTLDSDSESSDDDIPLNKVRASQTHSSVSLKAHNLEHCDFCEEVSHNKYDALVHNGKHIIIPLLKQTVHQCSICLFYFTSRYKLKHHTRNKHKNDMAIKAINDKLDIKAENEKSKDFREKSKETNAQSKEINKKIVTIYETDDEDDMPLKVNEKLKLKFETHVTKKTDKEKVECESDVMMKTKEKLLRDVKVVLEKLEPTVLSSSNITKIPDRIEPKVKVSKQNIQETIEPPKDNAQIVPDNAKIVPDNANIAPDNSKIKISSRLRFEDDIDFDICDDAVIEDLTKDCIVDMNLFDEPWFDELANSITDDVVNTEDETIIIDDDSDVEGPQGAAAAVTEVAAVASTQLDINNEYPPSTHHEELIKPGVFKCRRCPENFPTKFNQIQHEMHHMRIRKPRPLLCEHCDRFIPTRNLLKEHITSKHFTEYRPRTFKTCNKCGLKYSKYNRHLEIYHELLRCHLCNKGFETEFDRLNHIRGHLMKTKCSNCDFVATEIEIQEHQILFHKKSVSTTKCFNLCDVCCLFLKNKNNMQYVFGETVSKVGVRLDCEHCGNKFFHLTQVRRYGKGRPKEHERFQFEKEKERKKVLTNTERLKNIQQRLKMINKLSRF